MTPDKALQAAVKAGRLEADEGQSDAARRLTALFAALKNWSRKRKGWFSKTPTPPKGLYLWGGVGTGKSLLMDLFFASAPVEKRRRVHFHQFMLEIHARLNKERKTAESDPLPRVARAVADEIRLLCFDEFQVTNVADAMILGRLFEGLFEQGVIVVATSNRVPDDLYKDGLNRQLFEPFIELIKTHLEIFQLDSGRDYRLERLNAAPVYYTPLDETASKQMDQMFERLTLGAQPRSSTLYVQGRTLTIPCEVSGVARFSFQDLCGQPLGAADYLMLASRFHTILLDNVPQLTPARRDWAARFVTLIDTLYETRTKLVISAAAEPDDLYPDGDGSFEFQRTSSRLIEMRTRDYLAAERVQHSNSF